MTVEYHPAVQQDFNAACAYYEAEGGVYLAQRFEQEFRACITAITAGPTRFARYHRSTIFRRVGFHTFPDVILYRETTNGLRVTLLRHERRHPLYGMNRW